MNDEEARQRIEEIRREGVESGNTITSAIGGLLVNLWRLRWPIAFVLALWLALGIVEAIETCKAARLP